MRSSFLPKCKLKITRIIALLNKQGSQHFFLVIFFVSVGIFFTMILVCGRAEILVTLGLHFGRKDVSSAKFCIKNLFCYLVHIFEKATKFCEICIVDLTGTDKLGI